MLGIQQQAASVHFASSSSLVDVPVGPNSIAPIMDFEARFISSENELQETRSAIEWLTLQIGYFLETFGTQTPTEKSLQLPAPISCLHPANPSDFDGDRSKGRTFLNSCELVYALRLSDFVNDHSHVLWMLSSMKTGCTSSFVEQMLQWEAKRGP